MKLNKTLLIAALSLLAASGLMAKENTKKEEIPGVAAQPSSFFYTGKPYDADLGAYTFNYRNYDPQTTRWTTTDPSGFPDGANNFIYVNNRICDAVDPEGLRTELWTYYQTSKWLNVSGGFTLAGATIGAGVGGLITLFSGGTGVVLIPSATTLLGGIVGALAPGDYQATPWVITQPCPPEPSAGSGEIFVSKTTPSYSTPTQTTLTDGILAKSMLYERHVTIEYTFE